MACTRPDAELVCLAATQVMHRRAQHPTWVRRQGPVAGLHPGAVRNVAGDGAPQRAGWLRRLRLLRQPLPVCFWGFRLYLLYTPDGTADRLRAAPANEPEREVVAAMLKRQPLAAGQVLVADKGFAGREFEQCVASQGVTFLRPDRQDEQPRFGRLGGMRQCVASVFDTAKGQLSLERHGGRTATAWSPASPRGWSPWSPRIWHNWQTGGHGRHLTTMTTDRKGNHSSRRHVQ